MRDIAITKLINGIPEYEYNIILRVLSHYNIDAIDISKVGSVYRINTPQGAKCLKYIKQGKNRTEKAYYLTQFLIMKGFNNVAQFVTTVDNKIFVKYKRAYFYMTDWIQGRECDLNNINELKSCVELLSRFHIAAGGREGQKFFKTKNNSKNWPSIFISRCNDLIRYEKIIESKKIKSEFDIKYKDNIKHFYNQGLTAINLLNNSKYYQLSKKAKEERSICHNSFYYQNLLIDDDNNIFIVNLGSVAKDIRMSDLGKFIRRILFKKAYEWKFDIVKEIIEVYESVSTISKEELEVLLCIIVFPHKFWKLGRKRYDKHKLWSEERYLRKLDKQIRYINSKTKLIKDFMDYYGIEINSNINMSLEQL